MRHIISLLLENEPGALSRVVGLFSQRNYNIESLTVAPTEDPTLSRLTLTTVGHDEVIEQITKNLNKLVEAYGHVGIRITDLKDLKSGLEEAFAMKDRLVFLDIKVDTSEHVYPMQIKDGSMRDMWLSKTERT